MARLHGVRRLASGGVRVRLSAREREVLRSLPARLRPLLAGEEDFDTPGGRATARLYPGAYGDPMAEMEYRELLGETISRERLGAVEAFSRTLDGGDAGRLYWTTELDDEQAHAWLSALNDARLVFSMLAGITDESQWERRPERGEDLLTLLHYLGWLQEDLLHALMGGLPADEE